MEPSKTTTDGGDPHDDGAGAPLAEEAKRLSDRHARPLRDDERKKLERDLESLAKDPQFAW